MSTYKHDVLSNGLRVLTAPIPGAQSVTCMVMLAAGSRYETPDTNGIAHFSEHMFFKGTERRPTARDIAGEIDAIGGEFNAFTGKESTTYYVKCAAESRDVALDVLVDMLRNSRFDAEEIEREKGVIVEEMNMYLDTPTSFLPSVYDDLCYGDTPLGRDIIGTKETVRAATRETFLAHIGRWYVPERTVVGIGGAIDAGAVAEIERLFGALPAGQSGDFEPWVENRIRRVRVHHKASDQLHIRIGGDGLPTAHEDRYVAQVVSAILGGGMSSRLFSEVRERRGLAYYVHAQHGQYADAGSLFAQAGVDIQRCDEAVTTIAAELTKIARELVPEDELTKAKNMLKGRIVLGLEDPRSIISFGLRSLVQEGRTREVPEILAGFDAVSADDVLRVAASLLSPEKLRLAAVGPFDDDAHFEALLPS